VVHVETIKGNFYCAAGDHGGKAGNAFVCGGILRSWTWGSLPI